MRREEAIRFVIRAAGDDPIISTTGKASRELFENREQRGQGHQHDFFFCLSKPLLQIFLRLCTNGIRVTTSLSYCDQVYLSGYCRHSTHRLMSTIIENNMDQSNRKQASIYESLAKNRKIGKKCFDGKDVV